MDNKNNVMELRVINHSSEFELQNIINAFQPYIDNLDLQGNYLIESMVKDTTIRTLILKDGVIIESSCIETDKLTDEYLIRQSLKKTLYRVLSSFTGKKIPWGVLTGIRPTKIVHNYKKLKCNESSIKTKLIEDYCISREKANLMLEVARKEADILNKNREDEVSIYIGIPFCPTRCLYCSFTSYSLEKKGVMVDKYLDALIREINYVSKQVEGRPVRSLYIGGGTPTSLARNQLERLLEEVDNSFDIGSIEEYTIEAGRPDTLDRSKLNLMKKYGVDRISINPQTMNQETLELVGRHHSVEDIIHIFKVAREEGHENINMDIIIGLPGETEKEIANTMKEIEKLKPDSITVHTMAIKRASRLKKQIDEYSLSKSSKIESMQDIASTSIKNMGLNPYYMYRQKDTLGNLENVGYCLTGKESIYNIQMIAEQQTIIAVGAGAVTKIIYDNANKIKRIPNVRNLEQYINRIDEMIERKSILENL